MSPRFHEINPGRDPSSNGKNVPSTSNAPKNGGFKGKCNYCHKFGHKKTDCRKLKVV